MRSAGAVDYRLVQACAASAGGAVDPADPLLYQSGGEQYRGVDFKDYVSQIDACDGASFDLVVVDGRARPSCIMHSAGKVKVGGILLLDDADRPYYTQKTAWYLRNYRCLSFSGYGPNLPQTWATSIYLRER